MVCASLPGEERAAASSCAPGRIHRLLHRLQRYGDRVSVDLDERLRSAAAIDSSVFHLVLTGASRNAPRG